MINLSTVGTSKIAVEFVTAALKTNKFRLNSVYSRQHKTGKEFADRFGCDTVVTDLADLANDSAVQAVYIASPNGLHYEQSKFLLNSGKHVICEKTITENPKQFKELCEIANSKNLIFMEAIMPIYAVSRKPLLSAISKIGKISSARLDFSRKSSRYECFLRGDRVNIFDMSLKAGALMDLGVYCVYAAVDLFGMPNRINAAAHFLSNGADGGGMAIFSYDGFNVTISYDKTATSQIFSEILGDEGSVTIGAISVYQKVKLHKNGETEDVFGFIPKEDIMMGEANAFADFISGADLAVYKEKTELTQNVLACMEQIKQSAGITYN